MLFDQQISWRRMPLFWLSILAVIIPLVLILTPLILGLFLYNPEAYLPQSTNVFWGFIIKYSTLMYPFLMLIVSIWSIVYGMSKSEDTIILKKTHIWIGILLLIISALLVMLIMGIEIIGVPSAH